MQNRLRLKLPPRDTLVAANSEDPLVYYYKPLVGWFYRQRINTGLSLFTYPVESVLDVGCASGVLAETLIGACQRYTGIDTELAEPGGYRAAQGERAVFRKADIRRTDFPDNSFDAVFLFSVLEHIQELDAVMHEVKRILKPQGECIAGFPQVNFFMRACFGLIGFHEAQECHINRPSRILKAISSVFSVKKIKTIPPGFSHQTALYTCVKAVKQ